MAASSTLMLEENYFDSSRITVFARLDAALV